MSLETWIKFQGTVYARSSKSDKGPPGEVEILKLNPERRTTILNNTGWKDLEPGTLNVKVDERDVHMLATLTPLFEENAPLYPTRYQSIPKKRIGYWYYRARIGVVRNGRERRRRTHVLVRRAVNPCKGVVEVLAPFNIREKLDLKDGDKISVKAVSHTPHHTSLFTGRNGVPINLRDMYKGAAAFLIMNGPSLKTIDRGPLKFVTTMTVNNGPKALMPKLRPNFNVIVDGPDKFLHTVWQDSTVMKFCRTPHKTKPLWNSDKNEPAGVNVNDCPNVVYYESKTEFNPDTFLTEPFVSWGNSKRGKDENGVSGCRSCMMAAIRILVELGFNRIYIVGCDFNMDKNNHYAFPQDRKASAIRNNQKTYKQLDWRFRRMRKHFEQHGVRIFNCNPNSELKAFPFTTYEAALHDALGYTMNWRDYVNGREENTAGMYESKWYCCGGCGKSARFSKEQIQAGKAACECGFVLTEKNRRKYLRDTTQKDLAS